MAEEKKKPAPWALDAAHTLIQGHVGSDHKVLSMEGFVWALAEALDDAHEEGLAVGLLSAGS
jgi:hypothetical protein